MVAAAGDYSEKDLLFPASMSNVIAVASEDERGILCDFSSYSENKSTFLYQERILRPCPSMKMAILPSNV